jgi:hypothetical protein
MYFKCLLANKATLFLLLISMVGIFLPEGMNFGCIVIGLYSFLMWTSSYLKCKMYLTSQLDKDKPDILCRYFNINQHHYCNAVGLRIAQYELNNKKRISFWRAAIFF